MKIRYNVRVYFHERPLKSLSKISVSEMGHHLEQSIVNVARRFHEDADFDLSLKAGSIQYIIQAIEGESCKKCGIWKEDVEMDDDICWGCKEKEEPEWG